MDIAEDELRKEAKDVSLPRVQGLLQQATQTSTLGTDPHRGDLTCSLASHNLIQHLHLIQSAGEEHSDSNHSSHPSQGLKGVEALILDYRVGWPVSLVLSRRAITKYQLLSRLLYFRWAKDTVTQLHLNNKLFLNQSLTRSISCWHCTSPPSHPVPTLTLLSQIYHFFIFFSSISPLPPSSLICLLLLITANM